MHTYEDSVLSKFVREKSSNVNRGNFAKQQFWILLIIESLSERDRDKSRLQNVPRSEFLEIPSYF